MPSVYVGGAMHTRDDAAATTALALRNRACFANPSVASAVVNNPEPKPAGAQKTDQELTMQARL